MGNIESAVVHKGVIRMPDVEQGRRESTGDYVRFVAAGVHVKGEFHCAQCGYGVTVCRELPPCPMCGGTAWEQSDWSPFSASLRALRH